MINIAVCDDMPLECAGIAKQIENISEQLGIDRIIKKFFNAKDLSDSGECFDIIFLDIKMPEINGMELAKQMRKKGSNSMIVFITSAKEYVFEAYDVEAFQYLMKPASDDKLKSVLERAVSKIEADDNADFMVVLSDRQTRKVLLKDICYIESVGRIAKIHCSSGVLDTYKKISDLEEVLTSKHFFRCHKCFLINLEYVDTFTKTEICLENGDKIFLARNRSDEFRKAILSFMKMKGGIT